MEQKSMNFHCRSLLGVVGHYQPSDIWADSHGLTTIYFPEDTESEYPEYTLVHELTHHDLVEGSLTGNLQTILGTNRSIHGQSNQVCKRVEDLLIRSLNTSRLIHESIATYMGFIHQADKDHKSLGKIYTGLPPFYKKALSLLEEILPKHNELGKSNVHQYRNIVLAIGKFCLNTRVIHQLIDTEMTNFNEFERIIFQNNPDEVFLKLISHICENKRITSQLLSTVNQTAIDAGYRSFDDFTDHARKLPRNGLSSFISVLDQGLMNELRLEFHHYENLAIEQNERESLVNEFIKRWNTAFEKQFGHKLTQFEGIRIENKSKARIRITPKPPEEASGKRDFSNIQAPLITEYELLEGCEFAESIGLWMQIRLFFNPGESELPLGEYAPPLKAKSCVLVFMPCLPDTITSDEERAKYIAKLNNSPPFCQKASSQYIKISQIPKILERLRQLTILWHIDWIMYHFALSVGVDINSFPGNKYIHLDNADDETFFNLIKKISEEGLVEAYVQYLGKGTLLVASFYQIGKPTYYSTPIVEYKYFELEQLLDSINGRLLSNRHGVKFQDEYKNNMALIYHYGL